MREACAQAHDGHPQWVLACPKSFPTPPLTDPFFLPQLKGQAQGNSEELTCLLLFNRMQALSDLDELGGSQACRKLAGNIKAYIAMVSEWAGGDASGLEEGAKVGSLPLSLQQCAPNGFQKVLLQQGQNH